MIKVGNGVYFAQKGDGLLSHKSEIVTAHIRLKCSDENHKKTCIKLRDAVFEQFANVNQIQTVDPDESSKGFCVIGRAVIRPNQKTNFVKALRKMKILQNKKVIKVDEIEINTMQ